MKQTSASQNCTQPRVSAYAIHCVAIQNMRPAQTNAVFFPSAQMKNKRYKPNVPTETQAIQARTQSTQTIHRSGDKRPAPELHKLNPYKPAAAESTPPQRIPQGESRLRDSVVRCRRDRERFANPHYHVSDSGSFSLTAPARI